MTHIASSLFDSVTVMNESGDSFYATCESNETIIIDHVITSSKIIKILKKIFSEMYF